LEAPGIAARPHGWLASSVRSVPGRFTEEERGPMLQLRPALLLTLAAVVLPPPQSGRVAATQPVEEGYVTAADGARLFYQQVGSGPALIVPGRLFLFEALRPLSRGRTLIAYDMRNRGRSDAISDAARLTIQHDVGDLEAVRRHFAAERFSTVGYSYLGMMVVMYAIDHPNRIERLVQIGPVPRKFGTAYPEDQVARDGTSVLDQDGLAALRRMREEGLHEKQPQEYCEREWQVTRVRLVGDPARAAAIPSPCAMPNEWPVNLAKHLEAHFVNSVQKLDVPVEDIQGVKAPVLTIHGTRDRNAPYGAGREWARTLPNARLLTVQGAAHQVWADAPWVWRAIETFLNGEWPKEAEVIE